MATTGTYTRSLTLAEAIDEAWERCGLDPAMITARHAKSARQSIALMLDSWVTRGVLQWTVDLQTKTLTTADQSFAPAAGTIDLLDVTLLRDGIETPMNPISREGYHTLPDKDQTGRPDRYYVQRSITPTVYIWPAAENSTDVVRYYRVRAIQDTGALSTNPDIPQRFFEAFCADLAARLAEKWAPEREDKLLLKATRAFAEARADDRERADFEIRTRQGQFRGRG